MKKPSGTFTISLDFELYWGVRDKKTIDDYRENILGVSTAVPAILKLFEEYEIHATWACVGFLFFDSFDEMLRELPSQTPNYINKKLSPYDYIINEIDGKEELSKYHHAPSLIKLILSHHNQEIGTHTFSHYYCLEKGSNIDAFRVDIEAACKIAEKYKISIKSLVFPRNQTQVEYLSVLAEKGIISYRGNEKHWIYYAKNNEDESLLRRGFRLMDAYFKLSGDNCYNLNEIAGKPPFNIRSSRFLRPYSRKLKFLETLRLQRIVSEMSYAAQKGLVYHLWWHPHNFGVDLDQNISFLKKILEHYKYLQESYGMESLNMGEIATELVKDKAVILTQK